MFGLKKDTSAVEEQVASPMLPPMTNEAHHYWSLFDEARKMNVVYRDELTKLNRAVFRRKRAAKVWARRARAYHKILEGIVEHHDIPVSVLAEIEEQVVAVRDSYGGE
jgi:hypothetical protein